MFTWLGFWVGVAGTFSVLFFAIAVAMLWFSLRKGSPSGSCEIGDEGEA